MHRRQWLQSVLGVLALPAHAQSGPQPFAPVVPGHALRFPRDEGSHPQFRTEWWYVTGWLNEHRSALGFQVTFFRTRPHVDTGNPSRFDPRDILIAHAAVSEPAQGRLRHAQRVARVGFGLVDAGSGRMHVKLDDWRLETRGSAYAAQLASDALALELRFRPTQAPLLHGDGGYSRKGPEPRSASYYYSLPQLEVSGRVRAGERWIEGAGTAWLDHEWSSEYMAAEALGWDWTGINLYDGSALMAFRMRHRAGGSLWAAATLRTPDGGRSTFEPHAVHWAPARLWRSPRTGAAYPVAMQLTLGASTLALEPLMDDQENDTRLSTGAVYWEGAVRAVRDGRSIGRGYLELTGYAGALKM
ncbi:MAG: carotenoid 1,2-hydratase [Burkholderiales bacterium]|nr:carotenoid 1,2-hydratase [Burkholderiales bacterium]